MKNEFNALELYKTLEKQIAFLDDDIKHEKLLDSILDTMDIIWYYNLTDQERVKLNDRLREPK